MQRAFGGRYKNEQSAYQAYNQTVTHRRTGGRLRQASQEALPPVQNPELKEKFRTGQLKRRGRPGMSRTGLWKVNVDFTYVDDNGEETVERRSFVATSRNYDTLLDIPYIQEILLEAIDEHVDYWVENYDAVGGNYTKKEVEVVPIYRYDVDEEHVVNIDEIDELVID